MLSYIIILTSITYVNKAHDILAKNQIKSGIIKHQGRYSRRGCGYGLEVDEVYLQNAVRLIEAYNIKIVEILCN